MIYPKPVKRKSTFGRIVIKPADKYFSLYIRNRDSWTCVRCQRVFQIGHPFLQCSHFFGRRMESVRWDEENCDSLCFGCHRYWEKEDREGYRAFKIKQLGQKGFDMLQVRAYTPKLGDEKLAEIYYKNKIKEYAAR